MSSSSRFSRTVIFTFPSLSFLLPFFLSLTFGVHCATLREHRLSGNEPETYGHQSRIHPPPPSAEMLRALRYIQSLSQQTPSDHLTSNLPEVGDTESNRSLLKYTRGSVAMDRDLEDREQEVDNTQELLRAVLSTLQQTNGFMAPPKSSPKLISQYPRFAVRPFPRPKQQQVVETSAENLIKTSWTSPDSRHRQNPDFFEGQPLKRTNENAEEEYTPQKLATLQSVFEELSGISASKGNSKRENYDEDDDVDDDDDLHRQRKMALWKFMGTEDWAPHEEDSEDEEKERSEFIRNLEENQDNEDDDDVDDEEVEDNAKRSNQFELFQTKKQDPEELVKLLDFYLLKLIEKKKQEREEPSMSDESDEEVEKKDTNEDEEEEDLEEKANKPTQRALSQLIQVSQKLGIPPEEVLDLLQNKHSNEKTIPPQPRTPNKISHVTFATSQRQPSESSNSVADEILKILDMVNAPKESNKLQAQTSRFYERELPEYMFPESNRDDYDETADEDELANYLASEMLAQRGRADLTPSRSSDGKFERAVQEYFDKSSPNNSLNEDGLEDDAMLKILRYLDPETDDADDETDKTALDV